MTAEENADHENLQHRHRLLLAEHQQLQREAEQLRRDYARLVDQIAKRDAAANQLAESMMAP